jgi:hypothetical protein
MGLILDPATPKEGGAPEIKLAVLSGVREQNEHEPVELWLNESGRVVVRAFDECLNNYTDVDLADLLDWLRSGSASKALENGKYGIAALPTTERDE